MLKMTQKTNELSFHEKAKISGKPTKVSSEWGYHGQIGPKNWGSLREDWKVADKGKRQSPVDLCRKLLYTYRPTTEVKGEEEPEVESWLNVVSEPTAGEIENNGNTILVHCRGGMNVTTIADEHDFELIQFHYHAPCEHTIESVRHDFELHFVHQSKSDPDLLLVVGILCKLGAPHEFVEQIFSQLPHEHQGRVTMPNPIDFACLDLSGPCYSYYGSLTTPPATENVEWYVLEKLQTISEEQLERFRKVIPFDNFRPTQPLNGRRLFTCSCMKTDA